MWLEEERSGVAHKNIMLKEAVVHGIEAVGSELRITSMVLPNIMADTIGIVRNGCRVHAG